MLDKYKLISRVKDILDEAGFDTQIYENLCFDIIAKKSNSGHENIIFLKILLNIDAISHRHARDLKILSSTLSSFSAVVGVQTRHEKMKDDIIYERLGIAAFTPKTFENMAFHRSFPSVYRDRGGMFIEVDNHILRDARERKCITQKNLAKMLGVNKKSVYEHEKSRMRMHLRIAKRAERILNRDIFVRIDFDRKTRCDEKSCPKNKEEGQVSFLFRKIGFETAFLFRSPFDIIAQSDDIIFTDIEKGEKIIKRKAHEMQVFSEMVEKPALIVADQEKCEISSEIPVIDRKKLRNIESKEELIKMVKGH